MDKISIVPDTNVFISELACIEGIVEYEFPGIATVNISKVVLQELDFLKSKKPQARKAIKFIDAMSHSLRIEIEGHIDNRKMEVIVECKGTVEENNNDDKIMNYLLKLENPVLLTNDVSFALKCKSHNIPTISVAKRESAMVIEQLLAYFYQINRRFGVQPSHSIEWDTAKDKSALQVNTEVSDSAIEEFTTAFKDAIEPRIHMILFKELGQNYRMTLRGELTLDYYLKFILNNKEIFKPYLSRNVNSIISKILAGLKAKNIKEIMANSKVLYVMLGLVPK